MPDLAGYLPPVVARLVGDATNLIRVLEDAKARLADFAKDAVNARVGADDAPLIADLRGARAELIDFSSRTYNVTISADTAPALADLVKLRAEIDATKAHMRIGGRATAGTLAGGALGALFGTGMRHRLGGVLWGNTGGGFMSRLLSPFTMLSTMFSAGFGSIGSFAGFGPEHLAMTLGGLAGSGVEALGGAGLLGLGALGKTGVGSGADILAMKSARGAVSQYGTLARTIAEFGKKSPQAIDQANLLAFALRGDSAAALQAAQSVNTASSALVTKWHAASSGAQIQADKLMKSVIGVGSAFAGRVAKAAQTNLSIINSGLKPLFSWLKGPGGVGVFNTLEGVFKDQLPTAVHAFDQGIEVLLKTMAFIAPKTGGVIKALDRLFSRMNTPAGFDKWKSEINKLIGDFRMWEAMIKAAGHDLRAMFKDDAGEPAAIIDTLTAALQKLGRWEASAAGHKSITTLFSVHKDEIMGIIQMIGHLGSAFGHIYMTVAPSFVGAVNKILTAINPLLQRLSRNPAGAWVLGLTLIAAKLGIFRGLLPMVGHLLGQLALTGLRAFASLALSGVKAFGSLAAQGIKSLAMLIPRLGATVAAMLGLSAATDAEAASEGVAAVAAGVLNVALAVGVLGAIIALGVGIYELVKHWKTVWAFIVRIARDVWKWLTSIFNAGLRFLIGLWHSIANLFSKGWHDVTGWTMTAVHAVVHFFSNLWHDATRIVGNIWHDVTSFFSNMWRDVVNGVTRGVSAVWGFFRNLDHDISSVVMGIVHAVGHFFSNMWHIVTSGVSKGVSAVWGFFRKLDHDIVSVVTGLVRNVGHFFSNLWHDLTSGVSNAVGSVVHWFEGLPGKILNALSSLAGDMIHIGANIVHWIISGLGNIAGSIGHAITSGIGSAISGIGHGIGSGLSSVGHWIGGLTHLAGGGLVTRPTVAVVGDGGPEYVIPVSLMRQVSSRSGVSPLSLGSVGAGSNDQLDRIEKLLSRIADSNKETADNTKATVAGVKGLSSPAGVQAQMRRANGQIMTALRAM